MIRKRQGNLNVLTIAVRWRPQGLRIPLWVVMHVFVVITNCSVHVATERRG